MSIAQKGPIFLFKERRGQPREFWSLASTIIDGGTLPQDCGKNSYAEHKVKHYKINKNKKQLTKKNAAFVLNLPEGGAGGRGVEGAGTQEVRLADPQVNCREYVCVVNDMAMNVRNLRRFIKWTVLI